MALSLRSNYRSACWHHTMIEAISELSEKLKSETIKCRRQLHSMAEKSFEEHETAKFVAEKLQSFGYSVKTGVAGTGVIAERGTGAAIALRAELDGLAIRERNSLEYASRNPDVMHACGHDANMACVLAAAQILSQFECGKIRVIMQPASEISSDENLKSGAARMIEEGVLDDVMAIVGLHVDATISSGQVGIIEEPVVPQLETFSIKFFPEGDSGDWDAIRTGAKTICAIYDEVAPLFGGAEMPLRILSLSKQDKEDDREAVLKGRLVCASKDMFNTVAEKIRQACSAARMPGGNFSLIFAAEGRGQSMDRSLVEVMKEASKSIVGANNVLVLKRKTWAEDFSAYSAIIPGAMVLLGSRSPGAPRSAHTDTFDIDDSNLHLGAAILAGAAIMASKRFSGRQG